MKVDLLDFSIITPSFNMLSYLKRCHASVVDQKVDAFEHIVVDAESNDGTVAWLREKTDVRSLIEPDDGMYDAVNKGLKIAKGQFVSYLNCDEQYLPGTLDYMKQFFNANPDVDVVFGDALLIRPDGSFIAYRKGYPPRWPYIATSHLYVLTCTMFLRRRVIESGYLFDTDFKVVGDFDFVLRLLRDGFKTVHLKRYLSVFTLTGSNLSYDEKAVQERERLYISLPLVLKMFKYPLNGLRLLEKAMHGAYWQKMPLKYAVYATENATHRTEFIVTRAKDAWRWPVFQS